jgi:hypothetical protein
MCSSRPFEDRLQHKHPDQRPFISVDEYFDLGFHATKFAVPKANLLDLFEHHTGLVAKASYEVQSSFPLGIFEVFVEALKRGTKVAVTKENAGAISILAKEFWLEDLVLECSAEREIDFSEGPLEKRLFPTSAKQEPGANGIVERHVYND